MSNWRTTSSSSSSYGGGNWRTTRSREEEEEENSFAKRTQSEIENSKTRLQAMGMNPDEDNRSFLEKALNLPDKQNWFMDTLEILGRPGQAITNIIDGAQKNSGKGIWEEAKEGLTGKEDVTGTDIIRNMGWTDESIENRHDKDTFLDNVGEWGEKAGRGILGFGVDVLADPLTYTGAGLARQVGKGVGAVGKGIDTKLSGKEWFDNTKQSMQNIGDEASRIFNTQKRRGLDGTKDTFLKDADSQRRGMDEFWNQNIWQSVENASKQAGGFKEGTALGQFVEKGLDEGLDQGTSLLDNAFAPTSAKMNLTDNALDLDADPFGMEKLKKTSALDETKTQGYKEAQDTMLSMFEKIRNKAAEKGVNIEDTFGESYMAHVLTEEARKRGITAEAAYKLMNKSGNKKRELDGSVNSINNQFREQHGFDLFEDNAFISNSERMKQISRAVVAEDFKETLMKNPNFIRPLKMGEDISAIPNAVKINPNDYKFLDGVKDIEGDWVGTIDTKRMLDDVSKKLKDDSIDEFWKSYDEVHGLWKKTALFSAGFHVRNFVGNNFNMYVGGMSGTDLVKYQSKAKDDLAKIKEIQSKPQGSLTPDEMKLQAEYQSFLQQGLRESGQNQVEFKTAHSREVINNSIKAENRTTGQKVGNALNPFVWMDKSQEFGTSMDTFQRFAMYKWAREKQGLDPIQAGMKVKQTLFDYNDLGKVEQEVFKRVVPFYTWIRKNSVFQLTSFMKDPTKYYKTSEAFKNAYDTFTMEPDDVDQYHKDKWNLPVGENMMFGSNLPLSDMTSLTNPFATFKDAVTPLVKLPMELGMNQNFFNGKKIEEYEGQTKEFLGADIPVTLEHVLSNIGALRNASRNNQNMQEGNFFDVATGNMFKDVNPENVQLGKLIDERERLRGMQDRFAQDNGQEVPTLQELEQMGLVVKDENGNYVLKGQYGSLLGGN